MSIALPLIKSKARVKSLGEVFTPSSLVNEMLDRLPESVWSDPDKTFADCTGCGTGNFLVEVVRRKVNAGLSPLRALETTYGVDIMEDNVSECRKRLLKAAQDASGQHVELSWVEAVLSNVVCADALTYDMSFPRRTVSDPDRAKEIIAAVQL